MQIISAKARPVRAARGDTSRAFNGLRAYIKIAAENTDRSLTNSASSAKNALIWKVATCRRGEKPAGVGCLDRTLGRAPNEGTS